MERAVEWTVVAVARETAAAMAMEALALAMVEADQGTAVAVRAVGLGGW